MRTAFGFLAFSLLAIIVQGGTNQLAKSNIAPLAGGARLASLGRPRATNALPTKATSAPFYEQIKMTPMTEAELRERGALVGIDITRKKRK